MKYHFQTHLGAITRVSSTKTFNSTDDLIEITIVLFTFYDMFMGCKFLTKQKKFLNVLMPCSRLYINRTNKIHRIWL